MSKRKSNKEAGTSFEETFAKLLAENGFWVHLFQQNKSGQPADMVAGRNGNVVLIDAKDCEKDRFPLSRVEENQKSAMTTWRNKVGYKSYFALNTSEGIYILSFTLIEILLEENRKSLNLEQIKTLGSPLDLWIREVN